MTSQVIVDVIKWQFPYESFQPLLQFHQVINQK